jgi:type I restriction enzyme S subunit
LKALCPKPVLASRFLLYLLQCRQAELLERVTRGATVHRLTTGDIQTLSIDLPPLDEQERIVSVLDEAFEAIGIAKANAEECLRDVRAMFESELQTVFTQHNEVWVEKSLQQIGKTQTGSTPKTSDRQNFGTFIPFVKPADFRKDGSVTFDNEGLSEAGLRRTRIVPAGSVLMVCIGSLGKTAYCERDVTTNQQINSLTPKGGYYYKFFFYQMLTASFQQKVWLNSGQTTLPIINKSKWSALTLMVPPTMEEQVAIATKLDALVGQCQRLESIYRRKVAALDELKRSLLHRAFAGELTASEPAIIPITASIGQRTWKAESGLTTTDRHAGILALAYRAHERADRLPYFGHVKAEKIAHMVEARLGIDLGRTPVKDAAGPNDYPHLVKVEHRARHAGFFDFQRDGLRYNVVPLRGLDSLIGRTRDGLSERYEDVLQLIELMVKMDTEQAEIVATVYAAWNNLLLDGLPAEDEDIVRAAREDWHPDKLKIERDRFFKAIDWMRKKGLTPAGTGSRVATRAAKAKPSKKRT